VRLPTPEFSRLVKAAFEQRRKTLRNAWKGVLGLSASEVQAAAAEAQIDLGARGETLAVDDYRRMEAAVCLLAPKQGAE
jgi:16S rRNA (adenine1518-N6/adenine1519-N6)-dimethyltransferase